MLDLQPRVHLDEEERACLVEQELHGTGVHVARLAGDRDRRGFEPRAQRRVDGGGGALLEHFLVAALRAAIPLADGDDLAVLIRQDLHLDMPRACDGPLEEDALVIERCARLPPGACERLA